METLLISPASRSEIVLGKFLTVMLASVTTAVLNLLSMGLTGIQLARQVGALSPAGSPAVGRGVVGDLASFVTGRRVDDRAVDTARGAFQRGVCVAGRAGAEHERGAILHDASLSRVPALDFHHVDAGSRARPLLQPGADHRRGAPLARLDSGQLRRRTAIFRAGAGADPGVRGRRSALGRRSVPARRRFVSRVGTVQPGRLGAARASRSRPASDRRAGGALFRARF